MSKAELIRGGGEGSALWDRVLTAGGQAESLNGKVTHDCGSMLNDLAAVWWVLLQRNGGGTPGVATCSLVHGACWRKQEEARPPEREGWVGLDPDGRDCGWEGRREWQQVLGFEHRPNTARSRLSSAVTLKKNLFLKISCHNKIRSHIKSHSLAMLGPYFQMAIFSRPPIRQRRLSPVHPLPHPPSFSLRPGTC